MPSVKKTSPIFFAIIDKTEAKAALEIHFAVEHKELNEQEINKRMSEFEKTYFHSYLEVIKIIWRWYLYIFTERRDYSIDEIYSKYVACVSRVNQEPMKMAEYDGKKFHYYSWVFKGYVYEIDGFYSDEEMKLLIFEDFDKERRYFEKLKSKFNQTATANTTYERPRIPESVRIEVWRRDDGKCARCGSREKLEYDHIVPISKGGSNTARNIELLCEKCNRSKSNNVV